METTTTSAIAALTVETTTAGLTTDVDLDGRRLVVVV
jgi:hypothetical protein